MNHYISKGLIISFIVVLMISCGISEEQFKYNTKEAKMEAVNMRDDPTTVKNYKTLPDSYWKEKLTPEQYLVLRRKKTEYAFTGKYWDNKEDGVYLCAGCGNKLFDSKHKFDAGTGWPSFYRSTSKENISVHEDKILWYTRVEVICNRCNGHLGHVFNDVPTETGLRFCINSAALSFEKAN